MPTPLQCFFHYLPSFVFTQFCAAGDGENSTVVFLFRNCSPPPLSLTTPKSASLVFFFSFLIWNLREIYEKKTSEADLGVVKDKGGGEQFLNMTILQRSYEVLL